MCKPHQVFQRRFHSRYFVVRQREDLSCIDVHQHRSGFVRITDAATGGSALAALRTGGVA
jgi:hypothetical protein